jgi:hypothetical protein
MMCDAYQSHSVTTVELATWRLCNPRIAFRVKLRT